MGLVAGVQAYTGFVQHVDFAPDGRHLLSTPISGEATLWQLSDRAGGPALREVATWWVTGSEWAVRTPSGYCDASPGAESLVAWELGGRLYPFEQFAQRFARQAGGRVARGYDYLVGIGHERCFPIRLLLTAIAGLLLPA